MEQQKLKLIRGLARGNQWIEIDHQENIKMISFKRDEVRMNIYYGKFYATVATAMNHPTKGKTQLYRRGCDEPILQKLFAKPRAHTNKGYYRRKEVKKQNGQHNI